MKLVKVECKIVIVTDRVCCSDSVFVEKVFIILSKTFSSVGALNSGRSKISVILFSATQKKIHLLKITSTIKFKDSMIQMTCNCAIQKVRDSA